MGAREDSNEGFEGGDLGPVDARMTPTLSEEDCIKMAGAKNPRLRKISGRNWMSVDEGLKGLGRTKSSHRRTGAGSVVQI